MYLCINSINSIKEQSIVSDECIGNLSSKDINRCFSLIHSYGFRIPYKTKIIKKVLGIKLYTRVIYNEYAFNMGGLSTTSIHLIHQHIGFYIKKIRRIDESLIDEFSYTIIDTLVQLDFMLKEDFSEEEIHKLIIETGKVFKDLYDSLKHLECDGKAYRERLLESYNNNLNIKKQFLIDLKGVE